MKKLTIDKYILLNYKEKTNEQMAKEFGCCKSTISHHRKKLGISATEMNRTLRDKTEYICSQFGRKTRKAIAEELSCSISFIQKIWRENNLFKSQKGHIYICEENYFEKIDSKEKAYILGLIASDGCIYRREGYEGMLSYSVKDTDIEILKFIQKQLKTAKPIAFSKDKRHCNTNIPTLQISSDKICNDLLYIGIGVRKTFDMDLNLVFSNIPKKFWPAFFLGYFDGDGSIDLPKNGTVSKTHVRFSAPIKSAQILKEKLSEFEINGSILEDKRKYAHPFGEYCLSNTTTKYLFLKLLYSSNLESLTRKKEKAYDFFERVEKNVTNRSENKKAIQEYASAVLKWEELLES